MKRLYPGLAVVVIATLFIQPVTQPVLAVTKAEIDVLRKEVLSAPLQVSAQAARDTLTSVGELRGLSESSLYSASKSASKHSAYVPGEVIVKFKENRVDLEETSGVKTSRQFATRQNLSVKENVSHANLSVLKTRGSESVEQAIARLKADPDVEYVEPNYVRLPASIETNDPSRDQLWSLENTGQSVNSTTGTSDADIDAKEAWDLSQGSGVIVAVIDGGVAYNHPDLAANMWNGSACVDENGAALGGCNHGYDFQENDKSPLPTASGHSTHVAGTIAAAINNDTGIIGVAPQAKIMALKINFSIAEEVKAIDFAIQNGAKVINASYAGEGFSQAEHDAIERFRAAGGIFVAGAGNSTADNDSAPYYPASYDLDNIISVAATDQNDQLADWSNFGAASVDIGAPGVNIYSTVPQESEVLFEDFEGVTVPAIPATFTASTGDWGTYDFGAESGGKVLYGDVAHLPYVASANSTITSEEYDFEGRGANMDFWTRCDTEYGVEAWADYMALEFSNDSGSTFTEMARWDEQYLDTLNGDSDSSGVAGLYVENFSIPEEYLAGNFKFQFRWVADGDADTGSDGDGCFVDDVTIATISDGSENLYDYSEGTSMATPHVAGTAALLYALRPDLGISDVKNAILSTGDPAASLAGKTTSGKRLNAFAALNAVVVTPSIFAEVASTSAFVTLGGEGNDIGNFEIEFEVTASGTDLYFGATTSPVAYHFEDAEGPIVESAGTTTTILVSTADQESNAFRVGAGDTEMFTFSATLDPALAGNYRLVLDSITYGGSASIPFGNNHEFAPQEDFDTAFLFLNDGDEPEPEPVVDTHLDDLLVDGVTVTGFASTILSYDVELPMGTTDVPVVTATAADSASTTVTIAQASGLPGTATVLVDADDESGETTYTINFSVAADTTPPVITLNGDSTINLSVGDTFTDPGVTAEDDIDGDISDQVVVGGDTVDTDTSGTYTITYNVSDAAGNAAVQMTRTVNVSDADGPVLDGMPENQTIEITSGDSTVATYTAPTATDAIDGSIDVTCTPASGSAFALGVTTVECSASDVAGNDTIGTFDITVVLVEEEGEDEPEPAPAPSGGGGGGGSSDRSAPRGTSVTINDDAATTSSRVVELTLTARDSSDPITMQVSNDAEFDDAEWVDFEETLDWTLSGGAGSKTVYARFQDRRDNVSDAVSDSIELAGTAASQETIAAETGGEVLGESTFRFLIDLYLGMNHSDVVELQERLRMEGFFTYPTSTGYFGPVTLEAVKQYQMQNGIDPTGYLGTLTRAALNEGTSAPASDELTLETLVKLLIALKIIPEEKAEAALEALANLEE